MNIPIPYNKPPVTCEEGVHVSHGTNKHCDCGSKRNPAYRSLWKRWADKRKFRKGHA